MQGVLRVSTLFTFKKYDIEYMMVDTYIVYAIRELVPESMETLNIDSFFVELPHLFMQLPPGPFFTNYSLKFTVIFALPQKLEFFVKRQIVSFNLLAFA